MAERTHWKSTMNPDYLGAWAFQPGQEVILTIAGAGVEKVIGSDGKKEECLVVRYKEKFGPGKFISNATNSKAISKATGSPFLEDWAGKRIQMYTEKVRAFGDVVDAIRVRPTPPKAAPAVPKCEVCGNEIKAAYGKTPAGLAQYTQEKFGKHMCADCAAKAAAEGGDSK